MHGNWFYRRLALLVQYSFYKNVASFTCQLFFAIHSNWSANSLYDSMYLFQFNTAYTLLPIIVYGLTEQVLALNLLYTVTILEGKTIY